MSTSVDQRVVQMRFDNAKFEQNAAQTMSTLDKLKEKLKFHGANTGLKELDGQIQKVSFAGIEKGVGAIQVKLSTLNVVATRVMSDMVMSAINAGKRMTEALTIKPVTEGFSEYELKMGSVQTIMASTGEDLQKVMGYLNELNTYSDRTIYSFSDMTSNIGKFTNAGVKLQDAVDAIKGISNEAAISGANANEASRAMYNFAQALSAGYVKLIDWKSIENANMATVEFKQELINTAVELGTVTKKGEEYQSVTKDNNGHVSDLFNSTKNFNDALSAQWMTTDVLVQTLRRYTDETTDLGKKAYAAAQDVKTFSQLMDTLKEAVGSGWAETWEIVFGDFNEAKDLWTGVNNIVSEMIDTFSTSRNNILRGGLSTGWKQITSNGIKDAKAYEQEIINVASTHVEGLNEMIEASGSFEKSLKNGWVTSKDLGDALNNIVNKTKDMSAAELESIGFTEDVRDSFIDFQKQVESGQVSLEDFAAMLAKPSGRENLIEAVHNAFLALMSVVKPVGQAIYDVFHGPTAEGVYDFTETVREFTKGLILSKEAGDTLRVTLKFILIPLNLIFQTVKVGIALITKVVYLGWQLVAWLLALPARITEAGGALNKIFGDERYAKVISGINKVMEIFGTAIGAVTKAFGGLIKSVTSFNTDTKFFTQLQEALKPLSDWLLDKIANGFQKIASIDIQGVFSGFAKPFEFITNLLKSFGDSIIDVATKIGEFFGGLGTRGAAKELTLVEASAINLSSGIKTVAEVYNNDFSPAVKESTGVLSKIREVIDLVSGTVIALGNRLDASKILVYAFGVALTGVIFKSIQMIGNLSKMLKSFAGVGKAFSGTLKSTSSLLDAATKRMKPNKIADTAKAIAMLAAAVAVLAALPEERVKGATLTILEISAAVAALSVIMAAVGKFLLSSKEAQKGMKTLSSAMIALSAGVLILSGALVMLNAVNIEDLGWKLLALGVTFGAMVVAIKLLGDAGGKLKLSTVSVLATALAMMALVKSLVKLSEIPMENIEGTIMKLVVVLGAMFAITKVTSSASAGGAVGLTLMIVDLMLVMKALEDLSNANFSFGAILAAGVAIVGILTTFTVVLRALDSAGPYAIQAGVSILAMSLAIVLLKTAIKSLAQLDVGEITKGTVAVGLLMLLFAAIVNLTKSAGPYGAQAGAMILEFSIAMLAMQLVVKYLGGMDIRTLAKGIAAVGVLMLIFGMTAKMAGQVQKSTSTIIAMTAAIGILCAALALLTLLPGNELIVASAALSATLLSLAKSMQMLEHMTIGAAIASVGYLAVMIGGLTAALSILANLNSTNLISAALALSATLLALSASTKLLKELDFKEAALTAAAMGIFLAEVTVALLVLKNNDPASTLVAAIALSTVLVAMTAATNLLHGVDFKSGLAAAVSMGLMLAAVVIALNCLKGWDPGDLMGTVVALSGALIAMSAVTGILGVIGKFTGTSAIAGAVALDGVIAAIAALAAAFGALNSDGNFLKLIDSGAAIFAKVGNVIGVFIGNIIGGLSGGIMSGVMGSLPAFGTALSGFGIALTPFLAMLHMVDDSKMAAIGSITSMITSLTGASIIDGISRFLGGGESSLTKFATELAGFAPAFVGFVQTISSAKIDAETVNAAAACGNAMAELAKNLPGSGGILQEWFGEKDLGKFGLQLAAFGAGIVAYYTALTVNGPIDFELVESSAKAAQMLSEMANNLPSTGGKLQEWFGEKDLGKFGDQIKTFGEALAGYSKIVSAEGAINYDAVESSVNAGKLLTGLANNLPSSGGILSEWIFGEKNFNKFGEQIKAFGQALVDYSDTISGGKISMLAVEKTVLIGQTLAALQSSLPETGGVFGILFGNKSLTNFGNNLKQFGEGIAAFYEAISEFKGSSIDTIGMIKSAGSDIGQALADGIASRNDLMKKTGETFVVTLSDAVKSRETEVRGALSAITTSALTTARTTFGIVGESSQVFNAIGKQVMTGLIEGLNSKKIELTNTMKAIANSTATTTEGELEVNSPSKRFIKIGKYLIQGLINGVKETSPEANKAMVKMGEGVMNATNTFFEINSPSVKMEGVGKYLVQGIAEGITKDMSAEEAAKKKAENITAAFEDTFNKYTRSKQNRSTLYSTWETLNPDASESEKANKQIEKLTADLEDQAGIVSAAHAEYLSNVQLFGEAAESSQEAYSKWISEQDNLAKLAAEMAEQEQSLYGASGTAFQQQQAANAEYRRLLNEEAGALMEMGFTVDQVQKWAQEQSGWDPDKISENAQQSARTAQEIFDAYMTEASVTIEQSITNAANSAIERSKGSLNATGKSAGDAVKKGIEQTDASGAIEKMVTDGANNADYSGGATGVLEGLANAINGGLSKLGNAGANMFSILNGGFQEAGEINSPSKVFYTNGAWIMQGLIKGLADEYPEVAKLMQEMITGMTKNFDEGGKSIGEAVIEGIKDAIKNGSGQVGDALTEVLNQIQAQANQQSLNLAKAEANQARRSSGGGGGGNVGSKWESEGGTDSEIVDSLGRNKDGIFVDYKNMDQFRSSDYTDLWEDAAKRLDSQGNEIVDAIVDGFNEAKSTSSSKADSAASSSSKSSGGGGKISQDIRPSTINNTYTFNQTNNSPTPLGRVEVYRDTSNLFSQFSSGTTKK